MPNLAPYYLRFLIIQSPLHLIVFQIIVFAAVRSLNSQNFLILNLLILLIFVSLMGLWIHQNLHLLLIPFYLTLAHRFTFTLARFPSPIHFLNLPPNFYVLVHFLNLPNQSYSSFTLVLGSSTNLTLLCLIRSSSLKWSQLNVSSKGFTYC